MALPKRWPGLDARLCALIVLIGQFWRRLIRMLVTSILISRPTLLCRNLRLRMLLGKLPMFLIVFPSLDGVTVTHRGRSPGADRATLAGPGIGSMRGCDRLLGLCAVPDDWLRSDLTCRLPAF